MNDDPKHADLREEKSPVPDARDGDNRSAGEPTDRSLSQGELDALKERFQSMAFLLTGDTEAEAECSYCHQSMSLGEALLTAHLSGVLAHVQCPPECLTEVMEAAQPQPEFDFEEFVKAVDRRLAENRPTECHGVIESEDRQETGPSS